MSAIFKGAVFVDFTNNFCEKRRAEPVSLTCWRQRTLDTTAVLADECDKSLFIAEIKNRRVLSSSLLSLLLLVLLLLLLLLSLLLLRLLLLLLLLLLNSFYNY